MSMASYKGFDYNFHKAISNRYDSDYAFLYAARKHVAALYDVHHFKKDDHTQKKVVTQAFRVYDSERSDGRSSKGARAIATSYIQDLLKEHADQNQARCDWGCDEYEWPRGRHRGRGAFNDFDEMHNSLPHRGRSPLHEHDAQSGGDRWNRRPETRVPKPRSGSEHSGYRDYATSRPRSPSPGASRQTFEPSSPTFFGPPGPAFFVSPIRNPPPIPAGVGQFFFPPPQFPNKPRLHPKKPQYPTTRSGHDSSRLPPRYETYDCYPSEPMSGKPSHRSYKTQEFRPSGGDARNRSTRPPFNSQHSDYANSCNTSPRPSCASSHSSDYRSSGTYANVPPQPSRPYSPPLSHKDDGTKLETCYYKILGISRSASADEIRKAYRQLSMKHHPDRVMGADKTKATDTMAEINQANDVLSDKKKRRYYDLTGCDP